MATAAPARSRWGWVAGLFVCAPVCAEYLLGYDETTGDWLALLGGLVVLGPLYGAAALLIRELARRFGLGWLGIMCLAAAWGTVEAGLVDQSMFNPAYRDIAYWDQLWSPTAIPGIGVSAFAAWTFVLGHVVFSLAAPIAIIESLSGRHRHEPWLSRVGLVIVATLAVAGALAVWADHLSSETFRISATQAMASLVVTSAFTAAAWRVRLPASSMPLGVLPPVAIGAGALAAALTVQAFAPPTWPGIALVVAITGAAFGVLVHQSRSMYWTVQHRLAAAGGALLGSTAAGWFIDPLGTVTTADRLAHHTLLSAALITILILAARKRTLPTPRLDA